MRFRMWLEVGHSVAAGGQRVPQDDIVVTWATAKWIVQAQLLSQQDVQCAQSRLVDKPLELDQGLEQW